MTKALLIVDVQNDFCERGSLAAPNANSIIPIINKLITSNRFDLTVATQDWHPEGHGSFASSHGVQPFTLGKLKGKPQMMWPDHCVQETTGATLHPELDTRHIHHVIRKGTSMDVDSYSAFLDNDKLTSTGLDKYLKDHNITELYIVGLATDYCVLYTALDAINLLSGVKVHLIQNATAGVTSDGTKNALKQMKAPGVTILSSQDVLERTKCLS